MLIGNERGGLSFFKTDIIADENVSVEYPSSENKIKVYPNPNQGVVHFNNKQALTYSLHSLDGKSVRKGVLKPNARLDLNSMVSGVYVVQLNGQWKEIFFKKTIYFFELFKFSSNLHFIVRKAGHTHYSAYSHIG